MKTLCDISAFRYHRIPPLIHAQLDDMLDRALGPGQRTLVPAMQLLGLPQEPIHILCDSPSSRLHSRHQQPHILQTEAPLGTITEVGAYLSVTSPELTLFTLAMRLSQIELVMLMYEACGTFSIYHPTDIEREYLQELIDRHALPIVCGWEPVLDQQGHLTDLWRRPPMTSIAKLERLGRQLEGQRRCASFRQAITRVREGAASPFEAQVGIRLALLRRLGGEGLPQLIHNYPVRLSADATRLCGISTAYIDILVRNVDGTREAGIECQSKLIHDASEQGVADGNRLTALQTMGYTMIQLSYLNLVHPRRFDTILAYLFETLGMTRRAKTPRMQAAERNLCRTLFSNWAMLGLSRPA